MNLRLPPDLERSIFEIIALSHPTYITSLVRVAWRVKHWVEPMLYRVLVITPTGEKYGGVPSIRATILLDRIDKKPSGFFPSSVRHLFPLNPAMGQLDAFAVDKILGRISPHSASAPARPQVLAILAIDNLIGFEVDFTHALFRNVTHLVIPLTQGYLCTELAALPRLTHLAFCDPGLVPFIAETLATLPQIKCVVFLPQRNMISSLAGLGHLDALLKDDRIVCAALGAEGTTTRDLIRGAAGGDDYWTRADALITSRRAGTVDRSQLFVTSWY
ncbi:hypothetical protein B0H16DRAFT_1687206 [Mycena metata]|uniref:Uncharacterized protein n=1 Tax=Mycena metata TaxID=1033252 RepID=A0AAD7NMB8_9AGAR|nr:hypothetical protein B0H16DRAFT_1687206 [Mycena metata]